jgi:hypothetical protein
VAASYPAGMTLSRRPRSQRSVFRDRRRCGNNAFCAHAGRRAPVAPPGRNYSGDRHSAPDQTGSRGLTGSPRPLYSAGFATPAHSPNATSPCGGIGRRARLKIEFRKECWFDSGQGHQPALLRSFGWQARRTFSWPRLDIRNSWGRYFFHFNRVTIE